MDTENIVPNKNYDTELPKFKDDTTFTEDAENVAFKKDQMKVKRKAQKLLNLLHGCWWMRILKCLLFPIYFPEERKD